MRTPRLTSLMSAGLWGTVVLTLGGVWLLVGRVLVAGRPAAGAVWTAAARNDVVVGAVLILVGSAGIFTQVAFGLRDALAAGTRRADGAPGADPAER